jgi:hypothetical protein
MLFEATTELKWGQTEFLSAVASFETIEPDPDDRSIWSTVGMITDKGKSKCLEKSLPRCHFVYQKLHMVIPRIELSYGMFKPGLSWFHHFLHI